MFCKNCGQEVNDNAVVCVHCGASLQAQPKGESKTGMGVLLSLLLGLIGLIIGLCIYPSDSVERKTFIKGWVIAFIVSIVISIILYFTVFASIIAGSGYYYAII